MIIIAFMLLVIVGLMSHIHNLENLLEKASRNDHRCPVTGQFIKAEK